MSQEQPLDSETPYRHVLVTGSATPELESLPSLLASADVEVSVASELGELKPRPVTAFVIASDLRPGMDWATWRTEDVHTWGIFNEMLPWLTARSIGVFVGFSATDHRRERSSVRAGIDHVIARFESHAAMERGEELTVNAVEVPASGDRTLLQNRLAGFLTRRRTLANSAVVPLEALTDQGLATAITSQYI